MAVLGLVLVGVGTLLILAGGWMSVREWSRKSRVEAAFGATVGQMAELAKALASYPPGQRLIFLGIVVVVLGGVLGGVGALTAPLLDRGTNVVSMEDGSTAPALAGTWTYRSYELGADPARTARDIELGVGTLSLDAPRAGKIQGRLTFGSDLELTLDGTTESNILRLRGTSATGEEYEFVGYHVPASGVLVGSVRHVRTGTRSVLPTGRLETWVAVRAPRHSLESIRPGPRVGRGPEKTLRARLRREAAERLRARWLEFFTSPRDRALESARPTTEPMREDVASNASEPFRNPIEVRSDGGVLETTLVVKYAENNIGDDPVWLRSYNGRLVGPTLRAKPGDTLRITLRNELPPEPQRHDDRNGHHEWNTTNLHTHGLHVSPKGNSDNVLLHIRPGEVKHFEIRIPSDHPPGTFWYHAHKHGAVAAQVASGMSGALIVEGGLDGVPAISAAEEKILVLQQIPYWNKGRPDGVGVIEPEYQDRLFGPGAWGSRDLPRFTTVNGQRLPVIEMKPGAVQRWRFIASGFRERMLLKLRRSKAGSGGSAPETLPLHEVAVDGIALGKVQRRDAIELWPGYRSDVLVKAPNDPGCEYLLVDEETPADSSLNGDPEARKYVARIRVLGPETPMALPTVDDVKSLGMPPIPAEEVTGTQEATYAILVRNGRVAFTINGESYSPERKRTLLLGSVDDWTVRTDGIPVGHPFHIHVNPFYVYSIKDSSGNEQLAEGEGIWRDTIVVPGNWMIKFRTRYKRFTGAFVQHCHILDHEDMGMMELIEIVDPDRGDESVPMNLVDPEGNAKSIEDFRGKPTVLVFIMGAGCATCMAQIDAFVARRAGFSGVNLVSVSATKTADQAAANARMGPFAQLLDHEYAAFRKFEVYESGGPLHGTVILDANGKVHWRSIGRLPLMDVDAVIDELSGVKADTGAQPRERPNIEDLIREPGQKRLKDYMHAVEKLMQSTSAHNYQYFAGLHNDFNRECTHGCEHWNDLFLPWHRALLYAFEKALQNTDPPRTSSVMVPFWDWTARSSGVRYPSEFERTGSVLCDKRVINRLGWHGFHNRRNRSASGPAFTQADLKDTMELKLWRQFGGGPKTRACFALAGGALEHEFHDDMHGVFIGGDMSNPRRAARDPIFWSFHCYIDRLWDRWQKKHKKAPSSPNALLRGLTVKNRVADVVKVEDLGYSYKHDPADIAPPALAEPLLEARSPLGDIRGLESVAAWGGTGPFSFQLTVPKRKFSLAHLVVRGMTHAKDFSVTGALYLHPAGERFAPDDPEFARFRLGLRFSVWQSHGHGDHTRDVYHQVTSSLKALQEKHAGETWVLSWTLRPVLPADSTQKPTDLTPRELRTQIRFEEIDLILDWTGRG